MKLTHSNRPENRTITSLTLLLLLFTAASSVFSNPSPLLAVDWEVGPGKPNYILGFVAAKNRLANNSWNVAFGADVDHPDPRERNLFLALIPGRDGVQTIFPRQSHVNAGLIASLNGSVVEPNADDSGTKFLVTYYHDITQRHGGGQYLTEGADGYEIDMSACKVNPNCNLDTDIIVRRLTFQDPDKFKDAMNPVSAAATVNPFPKVVNRDFISFRDEYGPAIVFVSSRRQLFKSNHAPGNHPGLHQFNLFMGRQDETGRLINIEQIHYLTTTAAMSPTRASDGGFYFSYQANTEQVRTWTIWHSSTDKRWSPTFGIGHTLTTHFITECRTSNHPEGNVGVAEVYYPVNNNAYGGLLNIPIAKRGTDKLYSGFQAGIMLPRNEGEYLFTQNIDWDQDDAAQPGGNCAHGSNGCVPHNQRWGKATTPRCGGVDELFFSWSYGGYSNNRNGYSGPFAPYPGRIVKSNDLVTPKSVNSLSNFTLVVNDRDKEFAALYPTPLLSFEERFGHEPPVQGPSGTKLGKPTAILGTSKLSNTENLPWVCYKNGNNWDPHRLNANERGALFSNIAGVNKVRDFSLLSEICGSAQQRPVPLLDSDIGSVEIRLTNNNTGTNTSSANQREGTTVLGNIIPEADGSFWTHIPANAPFDMILRDSETGMKLLDRTSWASLKAGQVETSCGGCHNHQLNAAVPFEGTAASENTYAATDILTKTKTMEYDKNCEPTYVEQNTPAVQPPAFEDILPGLAEHCGTCHAQNTAIGNSTFYIDASNPAATVHQLTGQVRTYPDSQYQYTVKYINTDTGALGSPLFWYALGRGRLDGIPNNQSTHVPEYRYDAAHEAHSSLCDDNSLAKAKWVRDLGVVIDEGLPRKYTHTHVPYEVDRFHPSVAAALPDPENCALGNTLSVGVWDDSGQVKSITVKRNGVVLSTLTNRPNGQYTVNGVNLSSNEDVIEVEARDHADNRQFYLLTGDKLLLQCMHGGDHTVNGNTGQEYTPPGGDGPDPDPTPGGGESELEKALRELKEAQDEWKSLSALKKKLSKKLNRLASRNLRSAGKWRKTKKRLNQTRKRMRQLKRVIIPELEERIDELRS